MITRFAIPLLVIALSACGNSTEPVSSTPETTTRASEAAAEAIRWPDWRGPTGQGLSDATDLPLTWSESDNVVWKTPIHGVGHSTPVVWGNQIWLTTAPEDGSALFAVCVDFDSGEIVHDIEVFRPEKRQRKHPLNSYATPSPVIEEDRVYVHFGRYGTAALNAATGEKVWERTDLKCNHFQGPASSPVLFENLLILHLEGVDVQFAVALDTQTGETVWRTDRAPEVYDNLPAGALPQSYQTPLIAYVDGKAQLVSNGSKVAMGLDPRTGKELWRIVYNAENTTSRPVSGLGLFFVNHGITEGQPVLSAVRHGGVGDITDSHVVWRRNEDIPMLSSPVLVDDLLYLVSDRGVLQCLEAATGKVVWSEELAGKFGPSPLYADGRIYVCNKEGETTVIEPGRTFRALAENEIDGEMSASPVVAGNSLLLRTETHLYRIGND